MKPVLGKKKNTKFLKLEKLGNCKSQIAGKNKFYYIIKITPKDVQTALLC